MATIYQRGKYWWISYRVNGKTVSKSLKVVGKSDALKHKALIEAKLVEQPEALVERDTLVDEFWEKYLVWARDHKRPATIRIETVWWNKLLNFCHPKKLGDLKPHHIEEFKAQMLEDGLKKISVNDALRHLQSLFNYAIKLRMFSGKNPYDSVEKYKLTKNPSKFLDDEQLGRLLETAKVRSPSMHMYVALGALGGFRKREIVFAVWEWFDFETKRITLESSEEFELKDSEYRTVPLFSRLENILRLYKPAQASGYIFTSNRKNEGRNRYRFDPKKSFDAICKNAGVAWCTTHILRHTFGSLLAQKGVPLYEISNFMGHADPRTTIGYAHLVPNDKYLDIF